jgi:3-oxoacyl-[acyl-carrier-protein] synthase-3
MNVAQSLLQQGPYRTAMVLNCECNYREFCKYELESPEEIDNAFSGLTIGEAATATILQADEPADTKFSFRTWGAKHSLCKIPLPNARDFEPRGEQHKLKPMKFFTKPSELLSFTIRRLVDHCKEEPEFIERDHELYLGHAVSVSSTTRVIQLLNLDPTRCFETHARFGNTVSASLPLGLAIAEEEGRLSRGMKVMMIMGSAGVTTALASFLF